MAAEYALPREVEVQDYPGLRRYRFPRRRCGWGRSLLYPLPSFLVVLLGGMALVACCGSFYLVLPFYGVVLLFFLWVVLVFRFGHAEVEVWGGQLRAAECVGPLRLSRGVPAGRVRRLVVGPLHKRGMYISPPPALYMLANEPGAAAILAECDGGWPRLLAPGYPRAWLLAVAHDLAGLLSREAREGPRPREEVLGIRPGPSTATADERIQERQVHVTEAHSPRDGPPAGGRGLTSRQGPGPPEESSDPPASPVGVVESEPDGFCELPERPAGSRVVAEHYPDGVVLVVPPLGLRHGGVLGGLLLGLSLVAFAGVGLLINWREVRAWDGWWCGGSLPLAGLAWVLLIVRVSRLRAVLSVVGDRLSVMEEDVFWFWPERRQWRRDEIADIRTGTKADNKSDNPHLQLEIHPKEGRPFGLLGGRDPGELAWLATVLRRALRLRPRGEKGGA